MAAEPSDVREDTRLSDEEIRKRIMADPEKRRHVEEVLKEIRDRKGGSSGITAQELPDFLREHG